MIWPYFFLGFIAGILISAVAKDEREQRAACKVINDTNKNALPLYLQEAIEESTLAYEFSKEDTNVEIHFSDIEKKRINLLDCSVTISGVTKRILVHEFLDSFLKHIEFIDVHTGKQIAYSNPFCVLAYIEGKKLGCKNEQNSKNS